VISVAVALCLAAFEDVSRQSAVTLVDEDIRQSVEEALDDAGQNWMELAYALQNADSAERKYVAQMILDMPHIDRLEMTGDILLEHARLARLRRAEDIPDSIFYPYVMVYRISYEPVEAWRSYLLDYFSSATGVAAPTQDKVEAIVSRILGDFEITSWEFFGPMKGPLATLRSRAGTERELAVLVVASLRSFSIPARIARIGPVHNYPDGITWIEYYSSGDWLPIFLVGRGVYDDSYLRTEGISVPAVYTTSAFDRALVTDRYSPCGAIRICVERGAEPVADFESFSVSVLVDGELRPLDELAFGGETSTGEDGCTTLEIGEGSYIVQAGDRVENGDVLVFVRSVDVRAGETVGVEFDLSKK
jgi:hypothetical protein